MSRKLFVIALLVAIPLLLVSPVANADNVVFNQWYTGQFAIVFPSPLAGGFLIGLGVHGPILQPPVGPCSPTIPLGFANAVASPNPAWVITAPCGGTLTVTDVEVSGDRFQMFDNGVPMAPAPSPFTGPGQNPGWVSPGNGLTSVPVASASSDGEDINLALGDPNMSSATFRLYPGVNSVTGTYLGTITNGDFDFIFEPAPEPSSLILLGMGLLGVAGAVRRKLRA